MTPTPDYPPLHHRARVSVLWQVKERHGGLWVPVQRFHNLLTTYGMTAMAAAPSGQYLAPTYLVIEQTSVVMAAQANVGDTSILLSGDPTLAGDTQLVLSVGLGSQEVVTISGPASGTNPSVFALSAPLVNAHLSGDPVVRQVTSNDTMASVVAEAQYDPLYNAGNRLAMSAAYSPASGQNTMQFFFAGTTATNLFFAHVGLCDQPLIGSLTSNLHNYAALGYNHNNTTDLEIDVTYTVETF